MLEKFYTKFLGLIIICHVINNLTYNVTLLCAFNNSKEDNV